MVSLEVIAILLTGISISASLVYYSTILKNANNTQKTQLETRQAQLLMDLSTKYQSTEYRQDSTEISLQEWKDYEDWKQKYGLEVNPESWAKWQSIAAFYNGVGVLLRRNLIDISLVNDLLANVVYKDWENMGGILVEWRKERPPRKRTNEHFDGFDYLYNELVKYVEEHPELVINR